MCDTTFVLLVLVSFELTLVAIVAIVYDKTEVAEAVTSILEKAVELFLQFWEHSG